MRATITQKEEIVEEKWGEDKRTIFGKVKPAYIHKHEMHAVYLAVTLSEEEKAIVQRYNLSSSVIDKVELEDDPARIKMYNIRVDMLNKETDPNLRKIDQNAMDEFKKPLEYTMEHFLSTPCVQHFDKPMHANAYATRLKEKILPTIKTYLTANVPVSHTETLDF